MGSDDRMMQALATGSGRAQWGHAAMLALALQVRSAWLLLGVWVPLGGAGSHAPTGFRMLPAHPDWVLPALVQSVVAALTAVWLARRWQTGWALLTAAVASSLASAVAYAWLPNGLSGFPLLFQSVQEFLAMGILLGCLVLTWHRLGRWTAVPVVALVGGAGAGAARLLVVYSSFGSAWPDEWPRELAAEVVAASLLALVMAVLRGMTRAERGGLPGAEGWRTGATLGVAGLLALTVAHLAAGAAYSGWTLADARQLLVAAGVLALLAGWALVASIRAA